MIRKVYKVDPVIYPQCGGQMRIIAFLTEYAMVDRIISRFKLNFIALKPSPLHIAYQEVLTAFVSLTEYL